MTDSEKSLTALEEELEELNKELEWQVSHKRLAYLRERIEEIETELSKREERYTMKSSDAFEQRLNAYIEAKKAHEQQTGVLAKEKVDVVEAFLKEHKLDDVVFSTREKMKGKILISSHGVPEFHPLKNDGTVSVQKRGYIFSGEGAVWMQRMLEDIFMNFEPCEQDDETVKAKTGCGMSWQEKQNIVNKKGI